MNFIYTNGQEPKYQITISYLNVTDRIFYSDYNRALKRYQELTDKMTQREIKHISLYDLENGKKLKENKTYIDIEGDEQDVPSN
jgi:hypothetical protein